MWTLITANSIVQSFCQLLAIKHTFNCLHKAFNMQDTEQQGRNADPATGQHADVPSPRRHGLGWVLLPYIIYGRSEAGWMETSPHQWWVYSPAIKVDCYDNSQSETHLYQEDSLGWTLEIIITWRKIRRSFPHEENSDTADAHPRPTCCNKQVHLITWAQGPWEAEQYTRGQQSPEET